MDRTDDDGLPRTEETRMTTPSPEPTPIGTIGEQGRGVIATWHPLDDNGLAEIRIGGSRITSMPSYAGAEEVASRINAALSIPEPAGEVEGGLHPATVDLVDRFAAALKDKLAAAEKKYGYSDGWRQDGWEDALVERLVEHVQKGDPRDVAAFCAFAWHHGWSITPPVARPSAKPEVGETAVGEVNLRTMPDVPHALDSVSEAARRQLVRAAGWIEKEAYDASGDDDPRDEGLDEAARYLRETFDLSDEALGIVRNAADEIVMVKQEPSDGAA